MATVSSGVAVGTPDPSLHGVVLRYEGFTSRVGSPVVFREMACSYVPIIIDLGDGWTVSHHDQGAAPLHLHSFVAGLTDGPVLVLSLIHI